MDRYHETVAREFKSRAKVCFSLSKVNMERSVNFRHYPSWFSTQRRVWSFHVVLLQTTAKKCTKNYYARAQSTQLLFSDVAVLDCNLDVTGRTRGATGS